MKEIITTARRVLLQVLLLLACYFISRCIFTLLNMEYFSGLKTWEFFRIAFMSTRFDISIILLLNLPYIILLTLPLPVWRMPRWTHLLQVLFILVNTVAFTFELSDWAYFPFTLKRATGDVLDMISRKGDFFNLLPHFIVDYWYVPLALIILVLLLVRVNRHIVARTPLNLKPQFSNTSRLVLAQMAVFLLVAGFCILGIRGGAQPMPLNNSHATEVAASRYVPVVLNTPFSIASSLFKQRLDDLHYYTDEELKKYYDPVKRYNNRPFRSKNVVVIIVESLSRQFTALSPRKSYTPFLDSLMQQSLVCTQAYANALHSAEGIPAIIAGIPSLMDEPVTTSYYATNTITAMPRLLKKKGYSTAFYHGGTNGTMAFDVFCVNAGFDNYYGRSEYDNEADYDGAWGIWDEPFLQYFAKSISQTQQPFFASVFTLTSHDPFKIPGKYHDAFPKGPLPVQQCIAYTDMSLRKFFEAASKEPWYNNTLFVITADHCALMTEDERDHLNLGFYTIPIVYYAPGDPTLKGTVNDVTQQIDILPSVMDYLGYDKPFFAFGNSVFSPAQHRFTINEQSNGYKFLADEILLKSPKGLTVSETFDFRTDSFCYFNIHGKQEDTLTAKAEPYYKAFLQLYRTALNNNKMWVPDN